MICDAKQQSKHAAELSEYSSETHQQTEHTTEVTGSHAALDDCPP
jgi:hypothetical protein